jgi:hypothetical protein
MPNWTSNTVLIKGTQPELRAFREAVGSQDMPLDFDRIIPLPAALNRNDDNAVEAWCVQNWGTKWNARHTALSERRGRIEIGFNTAWSPPLPVIRKLLAIFPKLSFTCSWQTYDEYERYTIERIAIPKQLERYR